MAHFVELHELAGYPGARLRLEQGADEEYADLVFEIALPERSADPAARNLTTNAIIELNVDEREWLYSALGRLRATRSEPVVFDVSDEALRADSISARPPSPEQVLHDHIRSTPRVIR